MIAQTPGQCITSRRTAGRRASAGRLIFTSPDDITTSHGHVVGLTEWSNRSGL